MRVLRLCSVIAFVVSISLLGTAVHAASIAINFGADEPDGARSEVAGPAGVLSTALWNNVDGATGSAMDLIGVDSGGIGAVTSTSVAWNSNNTWSSHSRGEENNSAPDGDDRNLMTGYLDTSDVSVTTVDVTGIDSFIQGSYQVYVYMQGGINQRGGTYTIGSDSQDNLQSGAFDGTFVQGDMGNYLVFDNVTGGSFQLTAQATTPALFRAALNAIEIVGDSTDTVRGDVNLDGIVDIFDFAIIRDNLNSGTTRQLGDLDFSGLVEMNDFRIWKNAFNEGGAPAGIPEPTTFTLLNMALGFFSLHRRARLATC